MAATHGQITALLHEWQEGQQPEQALSRLLPEVIEELWQLARHYFTQEAPGHVLQPTALVNEVYLRLLSNTVGKLQNRSQFFAFAARLMREILVDHARAHRTAKRGGDVAQAPLEAAYGVADQQEIDAVMLLAIHQALERLERIDPRQRQIAELRYFGGLTLQEIADVLDVSLATVERGWAAGRRWLAREIKR